MNNGSLTHTRRAVGTAHGRRLQGARRRRRRRGERTRVEAILACAEPPDTVDAEAAFEQLQREAKAKKEYGYERFDAWWHRASGASGSRRCAERASRASACLEATCGDGMTGYAFAAYGHDVTLHDLEDSRDLRRSFRSCRAPSPGRSGVDNAQFDLVMSYNAFEHLDDPVRGAQELIRVTKPGGHLYIDFGPLYTSPWGLPGVPCSLPYPQYLFAEVVPRAEVQGAGAVRPRARDGRAAGPLQRLDAGPIRADLPGCGCEVLSLKRHAEDEHLHWIERFPHAFSGRKG